MKIKLTAKIMLIFCLVAFLQWNPMHTKANNQWEYEVGCGIADITGPPAEVVMMGYADSEQKTGGIHLRLRARSFIINDKTNDNRVVFVSTDTGMLFQSVKQGVIKKLEDNGFGNIYDEKNVMLSAIHTHSGPAGYAHHGLYNVSSFGFIEENYNVIVDGIYNSIIKAHNNLESGFVEIAEGRCDGTSVNRSVEAYLMNPEEERNEYEDDVDKTMTVMSFKNNNGDLLGVFNWFAVHPVSMGVENNLISSDNKGLASYLFEKEMGTDYKKDKTFVAAFAQANAGDVSPNIFGGNQGYGDNDFESTMEAATIQLNACKDIMENSRLLKGNIDFRHEYVDFSNHEIEGEYTDGQVRRTYPGAMGYSFAPGAEDNRASLYPFFYEGMKQPQYSLDNSDNYNGAFIDVINLAPKFHQLNGNKYPELWEQHYPKPILFATSKTTPDPWTPQIVPIQMFKLGDVSILAFPCEVTTMSGRRTRKFIKEELDKLTGENNTVIISSMANSYTSYLATPEEYDAQYYEGASTQFGKWTLSAYMQEFHKLSKAILNNELIEDGPELSDLSDEQVTFQTGVVYDNPSIGKEFGDVNSDVNDEYSIGDTVRVEFWSGHPNNNLRTEGSYLEVQRKEGSSWIKVADDGDWETIYRWERKSVIAGTSLSKIEWTIPSDALPGAYRIIHRGVYKNMVGKFYEYEGISSEFEVIN